MAWCCCFRPRDNQDRKEAQGGEPNTAATKGQERGSNPAATKGQERGSNPVATKGQERCSKAAVTKGGHKERRSKALVIKDQSDSSISNPPARRPDDVLKEEGGKTLVAPNLHEPHITEAKASCCFGPRLDQDRKEVQVAHQQGESITAATEGKERVSKPAATTDQESHSKVAATKGGQKSRSKPLVIKDQSENYISNPPARRPEDFPKDENPDDVRKDERPEDVLKKGFEDENLPVQDIKAQSFSFQELAVATENFNSDFLVGEGGFGPVYKGILMNGQVVAIKRLDRRRCQGNQEFLVEVSTLNRLHHENLVKLVGYCIAGDQRLLVYEFMHMGSLDYRLHGDPPDQVPLDWKTRMKIAAGAAKCLTYLHNDVKPSIICRDMKPSNILLGAGFHPKLSDFGLARAGPEGDETHVYTRVMGTYGYCAPEYAMTGELTPASDVYSFGVVLLELITGQPNRLDEIIHGHRNIVLWAIEKLKDKNNCAGMADPKLQGRFPSKDLITALSIARRCVDLHRESRPPIADVAASFESLASGVDAKDATEGIYSE